MIKVQTTVNGITYTDRMVARFERAIERNDPFPGSIRYTNPTHRDAIHDAIDRALEYFAR